MTELDRLAGQALQAAQAGHWHLALDINKQILEIEISDIGALNRLAKAYIELNKPKKAHKIYNLVLKIDKYNTIAQKNIIRLKNFSNSNEVSSFRKINQKVNFIEEPGITKCTQLVNVGEPRVLAGVDPGDPVKLLVRKRFICVMTEDSNLHLGKLPEDLSLRLITLVKAGNQYQGWVKAIKELEVVVFLREIFRAPRYQSISSFPEGTRSTYLAFTDPEGVYQDRPDTTSTEEQE